MKFRTFLPILGLMGFVAVANAQIVTDGDFEAGSAASWTLWEEIPGMLTVTYDYQADGPAGGSVGALRLQMAGETTQGGVYQEITLTGGNTYEVDGLVKEVSGSAPGTWFEVHLLTAPPVDGAALSGNTNVTKINTWGCPGYEGTFVNGCETPGNGQFTVPGTGSQTWYLLVNAGVCCGGGAGEYVADNVVVTDLGAGITYDTPPTPLVEDFNDGDGVNNYGGESRGFAGGGEPWSGQDASMDAISEDAEGVTAVAGDYALHIFANTPLVGADYIYYGGVVSLSPTETVGQDLTGFASLSFDIRLGDPAATTDWTVRLEDTNANDANAGNYHNIDLSGVLSTSYQTVTIPLADFVSSPDGGSIPPNLALIDVITFASGDVNALQTNPNIYIDNLQLNLPSASVQDWELYR